jgi:hypothetical protein
MDQSKTLNDVFMMGVDEQTYKKLLEIAQKEGKSVGEVTSEALQKIIRDRAHVGESVGNRKLLMEG